MYTNFIGRSNNTLDHTKLVEAVPEIEIPEIHVAMEGAMIRMKKNLEKEGIWPDKLPKRTKTS